jgi:hypothetical protein
MCHCFADIKLRIALPQARTSTLKEFFKKEQYIGMDVHLGFAQIFRAG